MVTPLLHLQVFSHHVAFDLRVNDVPVVEVPVALEAFDQQTPVNQFVVRGYNRVHAFVGIAGKPSECQQPGSGMVDPRAKIDVRLVRYASGAVDLDNEEKLFELKWSADRDPDGSTYPLDVGGSIDLGAGFGTWSWQAAPTLVLSDALREEARVVLEHLRAAMKRGDADAVLEMIRVNFDEVGAAYGAIDDAKDIASIAGFVATNAAEPDRVLPLDPMAFDFRLVAEGKMLETLDRDWSTSVRFRQTALDRNGKPGNEVVIPYPLLLARIGDDLRIVR